MESGQVDPNPSCVFNEEPKFYLPVQNVNVNSTPEQFKIAKDAFDAEIASLRDNEIGRWRTLQSAREELLEAENQRGINPGAYQAARMNYYTLLNGESWKESESDRVRQADVTPQVDAYSKRINDLLAQLDVQNSYSDVIGGVSEKLMKAKDDIAYIVGAFSGQLDKIDAEAEKEKREGADKKRTNIVWLDGVLNWIIIFLLIVFIVAIGYAIYQSSSKPSFQQSGTITIDLDKK